MILNLDCRHGLAMLPDNSVDAIVTDPPYGLRFMGKAWDYDVPSVDIWVECLRVLKPGGHLLAFAGTRTQHRMAVRIEDAGFEIRDMIAWVYGSGFPKHQSALKPALEPITMARKPAKRVTLLNIDACRVGDEGGCRDETPHTGSDSGNCYGKGLNDRRPPVVAGLGRYPANFIHDGSPEVLALFPDSAGSGGSVPNVKISGYGDGAVGTGVAEYLGGERTKVDCGTGSAARFFYCPKTSKRDRNEGLDHLPPVQANFASGTGLSKNGDGSPRNLAATAKNPHPTVKPTELMRYLCRLVTPPGGLVVDPFAGSGSTGKAAILEGFQFIGFELDPQYTAIANARLDAAVNARLAGAIC
jgi:DNA modification methylase